MSRSSKSLILRLFLLSLNDLRTGFTKSEKNYNWLRSNSYQSNQVRASSEVIQLINGNTDHPKNPHTRSYAGPDRSPPLQSLTLLYLFLLRARAPFYDDLASSLSVA